MTTDTAPTADLAGGFSAKRTAEIVGISYRQLDYWARTDLVKPTSPAEGSGSRRVYLYRDLLELKVVKNLLDSGFKLEKIRDAFEYLRDELHQNPAEVNLVIQGDAVLVQTEEQVIDLFRNGQGVLNVLNVGGVKSEIDAKIVELYPSVDLAAMGTTTTAAVN